ncbi:hypothetical protein P168DRAFT_165640 [Aspergillus campestris IBT 28561]|uniref:DUF7719 domain-containing protein n=1 Tax=Aspergillus campestris (strain IBT 28561) TaxID=1392248 RepID=A0A2I1D109_ASPC2|nr:uncharacterized protein P168DRAFT_165640 [Aspergillus campestris IBT 28561]PKY03566.1 hypothetical protein P168DRAFT_165640 [Aspergillus campestris IBT 28561]
MDAPKNRKQRRAAAAASSSSDSNAFDPSSIPMARPPQGSSISQGKKLVDIIAERQSELLHRANTSAASVPGTQFVTIDPVTGKMSRTQSGGFVEEISSDEGSHSDDDDNDDNASYSSGDDEDNEDDDNSNNQKETTDHPIPPLIDTMLLSLPLTTLHLTLSYLAAHQYAESIALDELLRESAFLTFPILTLLIHLAHGHIVSFARVWPHKPEPVSLIPWSNDKLSLSFLRKLLFPPTWRTVVFLPVAIALGVKLMTITNEDPYYAVMKRAPAIGTIWVWCILEMPVGATVLGALGPLVWGFGGGGMGLFDLFLIFLFYCIVRGLFFRLDWTVEWMDEWICWQPVSG